MAPFVRVELPGDPIGKPRARAVVTAGAGKRRIKFFKNSKTERYENALGMMANAAMRGKKILDGAIAIRVIGTFRVPKSWSAKDQAAALAGQIHHTSKPDFDNLAKAATDAFKGIVWTDDARAARALVIKQYGADPSLVVEVFTL